MLKFIVNILPKYRRFLVPIVYVAYNIEIREEKDFVDIHVNAD